jgi:hypothetical protein
MRAEKLLRNRGWKNCKGRDHLEDIGAYGRIIFIWALKKQAVRM